MLHVSNKHLFVLINILNNSNNDENATEILKLLTKWNEFYFKLNAKERKQLLEEKNNMYINEEEELNVLKSKIETLMANNEKSK